MVSKKGVISVSPVTKDNKFECISLLNRVFHPIQRNPGFKRDEKYWDWKFVNSSFGSSALQVVIVDSQIAGFGALWPIDLEYADQVVRCLQPCETAVDSSYRGLGLFKKLNNARIDYAIKNNFDLIFNFPNQNSLPGYVKQGWNFVGKIPWRLRIMNVSQTIAILRTNRNTQSDSVPSEWLLTKERAADLKWDNLSTEKSTIRLHRPPGYWEWRFATHPHKKYGVINVEGQEGEFAVFCLSKTQHGYREMIVADFVASPEGFSNLLTNIKLVAKQLNVGYVAMMAPSNKNLRGFLCRGYLPVQSKILACKPLTDLGQKVADSFRKWDFRAAMHDSI